MADSYPTGNKCQRCEVPLDCIAAGVGAICGDCAEKQVLADFRVLVGQLNSYQVVDVVGGGAWRYTKGRPQLREPIKRIARDEAVRRMG